MKKPTLILALFLSSALLAQPDHTTLKILFIIDGSGSMWTPINDQPKIEIAKRALTDLILQMPTTISVGLEVYGHRKADDCHDIELLTLPGDSDKTALLKHVQSIIPRGKTPITEAFKLATEQLKSSAGGTTIVLISDGKENCAGDPCRFLRDLQTQDIAIQVHVVGFAIDKAEQEQLQCIAAASDGEYYAVENAHQLARALLTIQQVLLEKTAYAKPVFSISKTVPPVNGTLQIKHHQQGDVYIFDQTTDQEVGYYCDDCANNISLPAGHYKLEFPSFVVEDVAIKPGEQTLLDLKEIAGTLAIKNYNGDAVIILSQSTGTAYNSDVYLLDQQTGEQRATYCTDCSNAILLPKGFYNLEFADFILEGIAVNPGQETILDLKTLSR